ncbi:MAG: class I SAM-dependent methyltransferase [Parafilimonas sp.]
MKSLFSRLISSSKFLQHLYKKYRIWVKRREYAGLTNEQIFTKVYSDKKWDANLKSTDEFYSGPGSHEKCADDYVDYLIDFIRKNNIQSITDIGCGDFAVGYKITTAHPQIIYNGCDVVKSLIERNAMKYGSRNLHFLYLDAAKDALPAAEMATIRQVLQHLSNKDISLILNKIKQYKYVLVTEHLFKKGIEKKINKDKPTGPDVRLAESSGVYLDKPPFSMPCKEVLRCREDAYNQEAYLYSFLICN